MKSHLVFLWWEREGERGRKREGEREEGRERVRERKQGRDMGRERERKKRDRGREKKGREREGQPWLDCEDVVRGQSSVNSWVSEALWDCPGHSWRSHGGHGAPQTSIHSAPSLPFHFLLFVSSQPALSPSLFPDLCWRWQRSSWVSVCGHRFTLKHTHTSKIHYTSD